MFKNFTSDWFYKCFGNIKSMAIVGNAPSIKNNNYGDIIDSYDCVCRINMYEINGFERYVGKKTDLYISHLMFCKSEKELRNNGVRGIIASRPMSQKHAYNVAMGKMMRSVQSLRKMEISFVNEEDFDDLYVKLGIPLNDETGKNPTSGLTILYCVLKHLKLNKILLIGFNFFDISSNKGAYYFRKDLYDNVSMNDLHEKFHPQDLEKRIFKELIESNPQVIITRNEAKLLNVKKNSILEDVMDV